MSWRGKIIRVQMCKWIIWVKIWQRIQFEVSSLSLEKLALMLSSRMAMGNPEGLVLCTLSCGGPHWCNPRVKEVVSWKGSEKRWKAGSSKTWKLQESVCEESLMTRNKIGKQRIFSKKHGSFLESSHTRHHQFSKNIFSSHTGWRGARGGPGLIIWLATTGTLGSDWAEIVKPNDRL